MTSMNSTTNPQEPIRNMADKLPFEPNRTAEFDGNQYFVLNVVNPDSATKTKDDIIAIRGIGGDVDPCDPEYPFAQERERLAKLGTQLGYDVEYPASVLIDSGNGLQPIYLLAEPLALPLVWFNPSYSRKTKVVATLVVLIATYLLWGMTTQALKGIQEYYKLMM